ncbi:MAG: UDP-3-O-(3-hydroxymyristoyl)glucosamine N-acyltransferase [Alphaproteobacteria bacterium]|nr:UDP-3-O-(3-hydroxymyristoyl)glucosamine N-acyltransferase [Alphaproteobacteria bacterium]
MPDSRFFSSAGPFSLADIAAIAGVAPPEAADPGRSFADIAPLDQAEANHVSFLDNRKYLPVFEKSKAGLCIVHPDVAERAPASMLLLQVDKPYRVYARIAAAFYPPRPIAPGISPSASVDASAKIGGGTCVEAGAVVGAGAEIGERCVIGPNAVIGPSVVIGNDCRIDAGASLSHCILGSRVIVYPGARIGQDGFGFHPDPEGHLRVPQLGRVVVQDDVEIGANTTIDRGTNADTVIGAGCMIDNLVQIAHNVELGRGCVLAAQVGISGSTKLGDYVFIGGQGGLTGHLTIGTGARIGAQSGVMRDIAPGETVGGSPAVPVVQFHRQTTAIAKLAKKRAPSGDR